LLLSESSVSEIIRSLNQLPGLVSIPQLPSGKPLFNEGGEQLPKHCSDSFSGNVGISPGLLSPLKQHSIILESSCSSSECQTARRK
jgi:hypothetical protein